MCGPESCDTGIYFTGGTGLPATIQNIEIYNWYLEGNTIAVVFDGAYKYQQVNFRNTFWSLNNTHISGDTVLSGSLDGINVFNYSAEKSGYARLNGSSNVRLGFKLNLRTLWGTAYYVSPTINTTTNYQAGNNVILERHLTIANPSTNTPVVRSTERYGIVRRDCIGNAVGDTLSGMVPFCSVT